MFSILDRVDKNAKVWCVMNVRRKEKLLPYLKNNVFTPSNNNDDEFKTRIYFNCYAAYKPEDFSNMGYVFHPVNHSVWFCQGMLYTNSIEELLTCIKRISNNFARISFKILEDFEKRGINPQIYLDG